MSVGIKTITNKQLLDEIQSKNRHGIYSVDDFKKKIKPGNKFFTVSAGESGINDIEGPFTLERIKRPVGRPSAEKSLLYDLLHETKSKNFPNFLDSLFVSG